MQQVLGDTIIVSQPTVSRIVFRVSILLARLLNQVIKMPSSLDAIRCGNRGIGLPGIDGAIETEEIQKQIRKSR